MVNNQPSQQVETDINKTKQFTGNTASEPTLDNLTNNVSKMRRLQVLGVILTLIILIGVGYYLFTYSDEETLNAEEQGLVDAVVNLISLNSGTAEFSANVVVTNSSTPSNLTLEGTIQFNKDSFLITSAVVYEGVSYQGSIFIGNDKQLFIKINGLKDLLELAFDIEKSDSNKEILATFTTYNDTWVGVTENSLAGVGLAELPDFTNSANQEFKDEMITIIKSHNFFDATKTADTKSIADTQLTGYSLAINPIEIEHLLMDLDMLSKANLNASDCRQLPLLSMATI